ncbi:MAG: YggS family pyridoxal phosphate-dependent enzyme [Ruminococcaceae bacterium]|nr:YggS family pyridoxal phosphate-dependent enzyme [Oscillospiraceae bacterium]
MSIENNLSEIRKRIADAAEKSGRRAEDITLIAVTKTHPAEAINEAIECGVTDIGENKVQEIMEKYDLVKKGVRWHLIGHLQTNKVKYIIDKVHMIHSVDSQKLMEEIERQAEKHDVDSINILIQVNMSGEETKFGISIDEVDDMLEYAKTLKRVKVCGLMTILAKIDKGMSNRLQFRDINNKFIDISKNKYDNIDMKFLSMGMSGDFELAIEEGSNMVRVGTAIFGDRDYSK